MNGHDVKRWVALAEAALRSRGMDCAVIHRVDRVRLTYRTAHLEVTLAGGLLSVHGLSQGNQRVCADDAPVSRVSCAEMLRVLAGSDLVTGWSPGASLESMQLRVKQPSGKPPPLSGGVLIDRDIALLCTGDRPMITPYEPALVRRVDEEAVISFGQSCCGYDIRCSPEWRQFKRERKGEPPMDPKDPSTFDTDKVLEHHVGQRYVLPPNSCVLTVTMETFIMPEDVFGRCLGKSTYARMGLVVNVTPLEPGWQGRLVMELSNTTPRSMVLRAGEGIAQIVFERLSGRPSVTYSDRAGKYMGQTGITAARV